MVRTFAYGYPWVGSNREFKRTTEAFWGKKASEKDVADMYWATQDGMIKAYEDHGIDEFPIGEVTRYDRMLDQAIMFGIYAPESLGDYYELCRGASALEMTKWFNTNYHYLVPVLDKTVKFNLAWDRNEQLLRHYEGKHDKITMIGPYTFLKLCKGIKDEGEFGERLIELAHVYRELFSKNDTSSGELQRERKGIDLEVDPEAKYAPDAVLEPPKSIEGEKEPPSGFQGVYLEEPAFCGDVSDSDIGYIKKAYKIIGGIREDRKSVHVLTYYGSVDWWDDFVTLPLDGYGIDFLHSGTANLTNVRKYFPPKKTLIAGVVDGTNVFRSHQILQQIRALEAMQKEQGMEIWLSNAGPLFHIPTSTKNVKKKQDLSRFCFADERLAELKFMKSMFPLNRERSEKIAEYCDLEAVRDQDVLDRCGKITYQSFNKSISAEQRRIEHKKELKLPLFPATTIGSYPQTKEIRNARSAFRKGEWDKKKYDEFVNGEIDKLIHIQEDLGLDVLVHGEFERTDMVEHFAEHLHGMLVPSNGWIISYGTRGYRPPIIWADVSRPYNITLREIEYAQSKTSKPVKGMLTGPITIMAWGYVRVDVEPREVAYQIAYALQDEIRDYEKAGIKIVQVDEPALREMAPLKDRYKEEYYQWAVNAFKLATNTDPKTQIHSHMCYCEFHDIIPTINSMDFDVISMETSRSKGELVEAFDGTEFDKEIGFGVWDIHSPAVPSVDFMVSVLEAGLKYIDSDKVWVNPDCGLKTRDWPETKESIKNMITARDKVRKKWEGRATA